MHHHEQENMQDQPASTESSTLSQPSSWKKWIKQHSRKLSSAAIAILLIGVGAGWYISHTVQNTILPEGYTVIGIPMGGLEVKEAEQLIHKQLHAWENTVVSFVPDRTDETLEQLKDKQFSLKQLGVSFNDQEADKLFRDWEQGGFWTKLHLQRELKDLDIEFDYEVNQEQLAAVLVESYGTLVDREPEDAQVDYTNPLAPVYKAEREGVELDQHQIMQQLEKAIQTNMISGVQSTESITLRMPLITLPAQVTVKALEERKPNALLAEYTTAISNIGEGHYHNIERSANTLDNWVIEPGQSIQYQDIAKMTDDKYGLDPAPIIEKGKFVLGIGGGLCQTSSTMYNAALLSGLEIVERHAHSLPVSYVPLGLDATYSNNGPDLIIRNNTEGDIVWKTTVTDKTVTIRVYGQKQPGITYEMETRVVKEVQPDTVYELENVSKELQTQLVQSGKKGYVVETYRVKKQNGYVIGREKLRTSYYKSQPNKLTADDEALPVHIENMP